MGEVIFIGINALLLLAIGASAVLWYRILRSRWGHPDGLLESILPARARERPRWNNVDAFAMPLVMLGSIVFISQLLLLAMTSQGWIELSDGDAQPTPLDSTSLIASIAATSIGGLAGAAIVLGVLTRIDRGAWRKLGLTVNRSNLQLGLVASLLILPPVLLINRIVVIFVAYDHEVLNSLAALSSPTVFLATFIGTAIVTPLIEEFLTRGLLQGALQGLADRVGDSESTTWKPTAYSPIVIASGIFALLHLGQGAAWIPLFFLSLGLGYLYRQTGSLISPIVVHMVLNSLTLIVEFVKPPVG